MSHNCARCSAAFGSARAAHQHMDAKNHFPFECRVCYETYPTAEDREDHEEDAYGRFFCRECDREFQTANGRANHARSSAHRGRTMGCPFCERGFATATGLTHHLEGGGCPRAPALNRDRIYRYVRACDPGGAISKHLLDWHGSDEYEATDYAWNGDAYACYLCPRTFASLPALNQHLRSPAHQQDLYHCPKAGCGKNFRALAALINHLESEACGFLRFEQVQTRFGSMIRSDRLLTEH